MSLIKVGDLVVRKSYSGDIIFKVSNIIEGDQEPIIELRGTSFRLIADAPESDLVLIPESDTTLVKVNKVKKYHTANTI